MEEIMVTRVLSTIHSMYTNAANDHQGSTNNELLEKLNYMIHL